MERSFAPEIMDDPEIPDELMQEFHRDLTRTHRWLGNMGAVLRALRRDPLPVRSVLDVGCGNGGLLVEIHRRLGVEVAGVDLRICKATPPVPIFQADAVRDPLPKADVAVSMCVAHHLPDSGVVDLIHNVGRSCRRFILLDLVRHPIPFVLFRVFVAPFINPVNAADGFQSIRRSFTPAEFRCIVGQAAAASGARFRHSVAPLYVRQIADISYC